MISYQLFFKMQPRDYPNAWVFTFKFPTRCIEQLSCSQIPLIPVVALLISFIIVVVFILLVFLCFFSCFDHFCLNPPWAFGPVHYSWFQTIFIYNNIFSRTKINYAFFIHLICIASVGDANDGKTQPSCSYSVRWWH